MKGCVILHESFVVIFMCTQKCKQKKLQFISSQRTRPYWLVTNFFQCLELKLQEFASMMDNFIKRTPRTSQTESSQDDSKDEGASSSLEEDLPKSVENKPSTSNNRSKSLV